MEECSRQTAFFHLMSGIFVILRRMNIEIHSDWRQRLRVTLSGYLVTAYADELHHDEQGIEEVCEIMFNTEDRRMSRNAAWVLAHLSPEDKNIYLISRYDELADFAMSPVKHENRGLLFAILIDFPCCPEFRTDLFDFCLHHIADAKMSNSCRSYMIKLATRMCIPYPELASELVLCLEMLPPGLPASVDSARRSALRELKKIGCKIDWKGYIDGTVF